MALTEVPTVWLRTVLGAFQASHFNLTQKYTQQPWRKHCYLQSSIICRGGSKCHRSLISAQAHSYSQVSLAFLSSLMAFCSHLGMESPPQSPDLTEELL